MSQDDKWELIENPAYRGVAPRRLTPDCHDRSPSLDIRCNACGALLHVHESQIADALPWQRIGARCPGCRTVLRFRPRFLAKAFAELRRQGWLA